MSASGTLLRSPHCSDDGHHRGHSGQTAVRRLNCLGAIDPCDIGKRACCAGSCSSAFRSI